MIKISPALQEIARAFLFLIFPFKTHEAYLLSVDFCYRLLDERDTSSQSEASWPPLKMTENKP